MIFQQVHRKLDAIVTRIYQMSLDLSALQAAVDQNTSVVQSAISLIQTLSNEIAGIAAQTSDPATEAALKDLAAKLQDNDTALAQAVAANTPAGASVAGVTVATDPAPQA